MLSREDVDKYFDIYKSLIPDENHDTFKIALARSSTEKVEIISKLKFKKPITGLLMALLAGFLGIDRFYVKSIFWGIVKMFTLGGFLFLWIFDTLYIPEKCKKINYSKLIMEL